MHTRIVKPNRGPTLLVRPLRRGDTATVSAMFERLGERSRRTRFNGPKPRLSATDLERLAAADPNHHVLVAYVPGNPRPASDRAARPQRRERRDRVRGRRQDPAPRHRIRPHGQAHRRCPSGRDHRGHRSRGERQPRGAGALAPDPERARRPVRRARGVDPCGVALTRRLSAQSAALVQVADDLLEPGLAADGVEIGIVPGHRRGTARTARSSARGGRSPRPNPRSGPRNTRG